MGDGWDLFIRRGHVRRRLPPACCDPTTTPPFSLPCPPPPSSPPACYHTSSLPPLSLLWSPPPSMTLAGCSCWTWSWATVTAYHARCWAGGGTQPTLCLASRVRGQAGEQAGRVFEFACMRCVRLRMHALCVCACVCMCMCVCYVGVMLASRVGGGGGTHAGRCDVHLLWQEGVTCISQLALVLC